MPQQLTSCSWVYWDGRPQGLHADPGAAREWSNILTSKMSLNFMLDSAMVSRTAWLPVGWGIAA
jgi:hypothetical protein